MTTKRKRKPPPPDDDPRPTKWNIDAIRAWEMREHDRKSRARRMQDWGEDYWAAEKQRKHQ
jgi:hypothetical protein